MLKQNTAITARRCSPAITLVLRRPNTQLAEDPRPPAAKKLTGRPEWRVRTGDYRVLYRIQDDVLTVVIVHAGHRRDIYEK